ncbi:MAG TPA: arginine--tRNA ligase, partial [Ferruginibacter sp.]|nr:arginine--tRNA ligase [Ferruginibacter sp.]
MSITERIQQTCIAAVAAVYQTSISEKDFQVNQTKPEFEGDYTIVTFSLVKLLKRSPEEIGQQIGQALVEQNPDLYASFNIIKGFINLVIADRYWLDLLQTANQPGYGQAAPNGQKVMVEYSSPNTNKPLHLGHLRNNFLGWSVAEILKAQGYQVWKSSIV